MTWQVEAATLKIRARAPCCAWPGLEENVKIIFAVRVILAALVMAAPAAVHAQLVKCVAKDGKVEYARDCPAGTTSQTIRSGPTGGAGTASPAPAQPSLAERDAAFKKRQIEQQEAAGKDAKKAAEEQQRREACQSSQAYVKSLEEGIRMTRTDPKTGERVFLEDAERAKELVSARQRVAQHCK